MAKRWTHKECFEHYGVIPKNLRWSWSGKSADGKTVAVTFWQDRFLNGGTIYRSANHLPNDRWFGSPGHSELIENLIWARDNCDGEVHLIVAIAKNPNAESREIKECFPHDRVRMRVIHLDEATCEFVTERIDL